MMNSIPSPSSLKQLFPLSLEARSFLLETRKTCREICEQKDKRKAIVVGPCSIHSIPEALAYAENLKKLAKQVEQSSFLIMRVYVEKARTSLGWKGLVYDPHLQGIGNLQEGLIAARSLLVALAEMGVPCAVEFVDPLVAPYIEDLVSWGFIGARTSSSQPHRQLASLLSIPVGFKNSIDGNIDTAICGALVARQPHSFLYPNRENKIEAMSSCGNPLSHIVLRGSLKTPNYTLGHLHQTQQKLAQENLTTPLMIDCSHGNAQGDFQKQQEVFSYLIEMLSNEPIPILGIMLESYLKPGNQTLGKSLEYGVSITDPCIDWETTERLILSCHAILT